RHEHGKPRREPRTLRVRHSRPLTTRFATGPASLPTPVHEPELALTCSLLHESKDRRALGRFARFHFLSRAPDSATFSTHLTPARARRGFEPRDTRVHYRGLELEGVARPGAPRGRRPLPAAQRLRARDHGVARRVNSLPRARGVTVEPETW